MNAEVNCPGCSGNDYKETTARSRYRCKNAGRRKAVKDALDELNNPRLNGIDYLEVSPVSQTILMVHFIHPPGMFPALGAGNFIIEGGVRIKNIKVAALETVASDNRMLKVTLDQWGDFSTYTLRMVKSPGDDDTPDGYDTQLAAVNFSFKVHCPSPFDCKPVSRCPQDAHVDPGLDYLAKDYRSFRRLMLDRLSVVMPDWQERNAADLLIALTELAAYVGDHLSYYQDAAGTEAYLGTARRRVSLRRHARLLDYFVHDGCNARTWVCVEVKEGEDGDGAEGQTLKAGTMIFTGGAGPAGVGAVKEADLAGVLQENPVVFETLHDLKMYSAHNKIRFYTWDDSLCCLPKGATQATLCDDPQLDLLEEGGDLLILEEVCDPDTGKEGDADPRHRHAVRLESARRVLDRLSGETVVEIRWHEEDALPFPLCITSMVGAEGETRTLKETAVARGNVVLADHGRKVTGKAMIPAQAPKDEPYRPRLADKGITFAVPYSHVEAVGKHAGFALMQDPHQAMPQVRLRDDWEEWEPQKDLLGSDRFAAEFVVEVERDGGAWLRFGDDVRGKAPHVGFKPSVTYRIGSGAGGNIGAGALKRVAWNQGGIAAVRNPLPAAGGVEGESMEEIRQFAPQAFRTQKRAVTESDYARMTQLHPQVQKAHARFRWTGSWYTVFVTVDRKGGFDVDDDFKAEITNHLEQYRMAGYDLEIRGPLYVPLDIVMNVCVKPGYFAAHVLQGLTDAFSRHAFHAFADRRRGFFHPDNFTFGQPLYLSALYGHALTVEGVASVEVKTFQRFGKIAAGEKEDGIIKTAELEILRLDNDPNFPENGKIEFILYGDL